MSDDIVLVDTAERVALVTMNRPDARNALNRALRRELWDTIARLDKDDTVDVIILTGADPAFCAGLDLRELAASGIVGSAGEARDPAAVGAPVRFFPVVDTPVIAAVNGAAITGGFEVSLQCSFIIASERARFADTHARVGILPGAGLSAYLVEAVGVRRAIELSLTGNFVDAERALALGLVNAVVPHADLLDTAKALAADIVSNDQRAVRALVGHYRNLLDEGSMSEQFRLEADLHHGFGGMNNPAERVDGVIERGRQQHDPA